MAAFRSTVDPDRLPKLATSEDRAALVAAVDRAPDPELAAAGYLRLQEAAGSTSLEAWPRDELEALAVVLGSSGALTRYLVGCGSGWPQAAQQYRGPPPSAADLASAAGVHAGDDLTSVAARLRALARAEMYRIGARDLLGLASLEETLAALTRLAEVTISLATDCARTVLARQAGEVVGLDDKPLGFVVVGLGKLGGGELNYSSDVDLMYLYADDPVKPDCPSPRERFARLAGEVTNLVGATTVDGCIFRVDLRLRPEGAAGPLVNSIRNALTYYEGWGDIWERGALAKARPVGGQHEVAHEFIAQIRPFVYRRHLDYLTVEDFRRMKDRIDAEQIVRARGKRDVKLGAGGIRELEFVVQVLQLIHAGHEPALQVEGTMAALRVLEACSLIETEQATQLRQAYAFLRNVEHAVQIVEQRQTQRLPDDPRGLWTLARRLGYGLGRRGQPLGGDALSAFEADWLRHTGVVREAFVRFLELRADERRAQTHGREASADPRAVALLAMLQAGEQDEAKRLLGEMGFGDTERAARTLARLYHGRVSGPASPQRRRAMEAMAPKLLEAVTRSADPATALDQLVEFLIHTGAHTSYLALLGGSPATMGILITLFATSPYLASSLAGHPELLDMLVRSDADPSGRDVATLREALDEDLTGPFDEEGVMAALRRFRTSEVIRAGIDDLSGLLNAEEVQHLLSDLGEACLCAAADQAKRLVAERTGEPVDGVSLVIVAMGKMGGREMTYGSDLDLMFVYRGGRPGFDERAHGFATRWVQKTMSLLQSSTRDGVAYRIDARLRPSGKSGPLVVSLDRFVEYHRKEAALWERQAHIRARVVYGEPGLRETVEQSVEQFVYGTGLTPAGAAEIDGLRRRVEEELAREARGRTNIKTGRGGIVDIEFLVQMIQLREGHARRELRCRGTLDSIRRLRRTGILPVEVADRVEKHYLFLRRVEARMRLERDRPVEELGTDAAALVPLARRLGFTSPDPGLALLEQYERTRADVRAIYERQFSGGFDV